MKTRLLSRPCQWLTAYFRARNTLFVINLFHSFIKVLSLIIFICTPLTMLNSSHAANIHAIVINEILPDPNSKTFNFDTDGDGIAEVEDEFVEFYNTSAVHIDISGWKIWDNQYAYSIPEGSVLPAGGYLTIVGDWMDSPVTAKSCVIIYGRHSGNGLGNTGDVIALVDPGSGEYIAGYYNGDTVADLPSGFDGTTLIRATNFGRDTDGQSLTRSPDGNIDAPIISATLPTPVFNDNCGNVNGDATPLTIDELDQNNQTDNAITQETEPAGTYIAGGSVNHRTIDENQQRAFQITTKGENVSLSISGGDDADKFTIDSRGRLSFLSAPDFENPGDFDNDNTYQLKITASGRYGSDTQTIYITVRDKPEPLNLLTSCTANSMTASYCPSLRSIPVINGRLTDGSSWLEQDRELVLEFIELARCNEPERVTQIEFLYKTMLGRGFDAYGLAWWINKALLQSEAGISEQQIINNIIKGFFHSSEFQQISNANQLQDESGQWSGLNLIDYLYREIRQEQTTDGTIFWLDILTEHGLTKVLTEFSHTYSANCNGVTQNSVPLLVPD